MIEKKILTQISTLPGHSTQNGYAMSAVLLAFLAPLFGEYLLGNLTIFEIVYLPFLVPLYGAGALLILGIAYGLFEEGVVDQMLFNRLYFAGQDQLSETYIPALGIDA